MYLVILNGQVIETYQYKPSGFTQGAELVKWSKPEPEERIIDGVPYPPLDPRNDQEKLNSAKQRKLEEINNWDESVRLEGVEIGPYRFSYDDKSINQFVNLVSSAKELLTQGQITLDTLVSLVDANGDTLKVKVSALRNGLKIYFQAAQNQNEAVGNLKAALKAAKTIEDVSNIIV
jgi:hypothetical protein